MRRRSWWGQDPEVRTGVRGRPVRRPHRRERGAEAGGQRREVRHGALLLGRGHPGLARLQRERCHGLHRGHQPQSHRERLQESVPHHRQRHPDRLEHGRLCGPGAQGQAGRRDRRPHGLRPGRGRPVHQGGEETGPHRGWPGVHDRQVHRFPVHPHQPQGQATAGHLLWRLCPAGGAHGAADEATGPHGQAPGRRHAVQPRGRQARWRGRERHGVLRPGRHHARQGRERPGLQGQVQGALQARCRCLCGVVLRPGDVHGRCHAESPVRGACQGRSADVPQATRAWRAPMPTTTRATSSRRRSRC